MRVLVKLVCTECKRVNYYTDKNKKNSPDLLQFKKYCPFLRKYTMHKEKK